MASLHLGGVQRRTKDKQHQAAAGSHYPCMFVDAETPLTWVAGSYTAVVSISTALLPNPSSVSPKQPAAKVMEHHIGMTRTEPAKSVAWQS